MAQLATDASAANPLRKRVDQLKDMGSRADAPVIVTFTLPSEIDATSVSVVGDFNDWDPNRGVMERDDDGVFSCSLEIEPGRTYQYRYLLDGDRWTNDWSAHAYAPNIFGGDDSVLDLTDRQRSLNHAHSSPDE